MTDRILKWDVPVDDEVHKIGWGEVLHVDCQFGPNSVQVWTLETDVDNHAPTPERLVQVFGTGQPLPDEAEYLGTAVAAEGRLVWHLIAVQGGTSMETKDYWTVSAVTPYGMVSTSVVAERDVKTDVDYHKVCQSGLNHMQWLMQNGFDDSFDNPDVG